MHSDYFTPIRIALVFTALLIGCRKDRIYSSGNSSNIATVRTLAGNGVAGYKDGGNNSAEFFLMHMNVGNAQFHTPWGIATDSQGNVYVADVGNSCIRMVAPDGKVSTFAGNGSEGLRDGRGTEAQFSAPYGIAIDTEGNLYVVDLGNHNIRKITPERYVSTLAGNGIAGFWNGSGTDAQFNYPEGVAVDAFGNVYVADGGNNCIRKITPSGEVSTFAGSGFPGFQDNLGTDAQFSRPTGVAVDVYGNIYVADHDNHSIRKITPDADVITFAGNGNYGIDDGVGRDAHFSFPSSITTDNEGNVYIGQSYSIRKITPWGEVSTLAGGEIGYADGWGTNARFYSPTGITTDSEGNILVADNYNNRIRKVTPNGNVATIAGNGDRGFVDNAIPAFVFTSPTGMAADANGNVYVADLGNNRIRKITPTGEASTFAGDGQEGFADGINSQAQFYWPSGVATDAVGNVYVADSRNNRIRKISVAGNVTTLAGSGKQGYYDDVYLERQEFNNPLGLATDALGNVYIADAGNRCIRKVTPNGAVSTLAGNGEEGSADGNGTAARFSKPVGIATDAQGNVYVVDAGNNSIRKITPIGQVTTLAGELSPSGYSAGPGYFNGNGATARFNTPMGISIDADGNVFVADAHNNCIRKLTPVGGKNYSVSTFVGSPEQGYFDGNGIDARFTLPAGLTVDAQGNIYVADAGNHSIRKIIRQY